MNPLFHVTASALSIALVALPACAGQSPAPPPVSLGNPQVSGDPTRQDTPGGIGYADIADLVLSAPVIADATVRSTAKIKPAEAPDLAPGLVRLYVEVDVTALIRGADGLPPRIGYLLDVAPDSAGRVPKFKKARVLIFARPVPGAVNQVQLIAPDAQLGWTPTADARARKIAKDALASDAPPVITGIGNAFHVAGALPGEGETQIFLTTADQRPVSLSILRRPGEQPRWAVALSEIVDESAAPPAPETLLWYRMACALPSTLPERSTGSLEAADATIAREDYAYVLAALGPCGRTRKI
ncbi:hypothetical protein EQZ23_02795 [Sphingomonas sp. UV9]|uniref:hypothetical protein n=1 Tax=Sphingomonas sp. UV9 TaxID=1851410 RepID=UPI000FFCBC4C|nr:hypothetical protein [Sphingomonas sp. UV9]RXD07032.1 hypothetical protein EQZ23_02795 [Sphingomonas sp. UV9]